MPKSLYTERHRAIALAIGEHRRAKGLTQWDVARAIGGSWSQPMIANIESGGRRVDLVEMLTIADIIDLDVNALIDRLKAIPR